MGFKNGVDVLYLRANFGGDPPQHDNFMGLYVMSAVRFHAMLLTQ